MMRRDNGTVNLIELIICTLIMAALCFLTRDAFWAAPVLAMPLIYIFARQGYVAGAGITVAFAAIELAMYGGNAGYTLVCTLPVVITVGIMLKMRIRILYTAAAGVAALFVSAAALTIYIKLTTGYDAAQYIAINMTASAETSDEMAAASSWIAALTQLVNGDMSADSFLKIFSNVEAVRDYALQPATEKLLETYFTAMLPMAVSTVSVYGGLLDMVIPRAAAKKRGADMMSIPSFDMFILPRKYSKYIIISFILGMIPSVAEIDRLVVAGNILFYAAGAIFTVQGLSFIYFLLHRKIKMRWLCVLILVVIYVVCALIGFDALLWLGMFEQLFRIRESMSIFGGGAGK